MPPRSLAEASRNTCTSALGVHGLVGWKVRTCPLPTTWTLPATNSPFWDTRSAPSALAASTRSLRNSTSGVVSPTPYAPLPGRWPTTEGRDASRLPAVVNELLKSLSALPDRSWRPLVATTVITLSAGRVPPFRDTVRLSAEIPLTYPNRPPLANNPRVLLVTVEGLSDSEKVTTTAAFKPTSVVPSFGVTLSTVGGVVSMVAAVRNHS